MMSFRFSTNIITASLAFFLPLVSFAYSADTLLDATTETITSIDLIDTINASDAIVSEPLDVCGETYEMTDRLWLISSRHLSSSACCIDLESPELRFSRLYCNGQTIPSSQDEYVSALQGDRTTVVYVHGNRMEWNDAIQRGLFVYRQTNRFRSNRQPIDWVIWSWPSEQDGILVHDAREKATRTDAQGLYLASLLRKHVQMSSPTTLIGYSFGARVVSGSLHALAGGSLGGRTLPGESITGASFDVGMVAPALENDWLASHGYHRLATKNLDRLTVLYNQRDAVLKRYWLIDRVRGNVALGFSGPRSFGLRDDNTRVPVRSRDCSPIVGIKHDEEDYYNQPCRAGREMAILVQDALQRTP